MNKENMKPFFEGMSDEIKDKFKSCKSKEELQTLLSSEAIELSDAQLDSISGGWNDDFEETQKY